MADTFTANGKIRKIEQGAYPEAWAARLNDDALELLDDMISGTELINLGVATSYVLDPLTNGTDSESRAMILRFTGAPESAVEVTVPASVTSKLYLVENDCGQALTIKYAATAGVMVSDGARAFVRVDGTDVLSVATITSADIAATLNSLKRTPAEITAGITPTDGAYLEGWIERYGGGAGVAAATNVTAINNATLVMSAKGGGDVIFPAGTIEYNAQLVPKSKVNWRGAGTDATVLSYTGTGLSIKGAGADTNNRKIFTISNMTIDGDDASDSTAKCIDFGWNMRALLLFNVKIINFPHYGIDFVDQNWNIAFAFVWVERCGHSANNSCGIHKDAAVDSGTWNAIYCKQVYAEGCGSATSAAGGWNIQTTTRNRGLYLDHCQAEGNFGTDEVLITNMDDLEFTDFYMERVNVAGQSVGIELQGCKGSIRGGYLTGESAVNNTYALQLKAGCDISIDGVNFGSNWTKYVDLQGSKLHAGKCTDFGGEVLGSDFQIDSTSQLSGYVSPRFHVVKSANQTGIVTNTFTKVAFQTESYDETGAFDNATNYRFTPRTHGKYLLMASVSWDDVETTLDQFVIAIYKNGSALASVTARPSATEAFTQTITAQVEVALTTDYFEVFVRHLGSANRTITDDDAQTWFCGHLLK